MVSLPTGQNLLTSAIILVGTVFAALWTVAEPVIGIGIFPAGILGVSAAAFALALYLLRRSGVSWSRRITWAALPALIGCSSTAVLCSMLTEVHADNQIFQFSTRRYHQPHVLVVLPSFVRASISYRQQKCVVPFPETLNEFCHGAHSTDSFLRYEVVLFSEVEEVLEIVQENNTRPEISFAASWNDAGLEKFDTIVLGGPVSTAAYKLVRDKIVDELERKNFRSGALPFDFSRHVYEQLFTAEAYKDHALNGIVRHYDGEGKALTTEKAMEQHCEDSSKNYFFPSTTIGQVNSHGSRKIGACNVRDTDAIGVAPETTTLSVGADGGLTGESQDKRERASEYAIDYAIVLRGPNPVDEKRRLLLAAGTHSEGTKCALRFLLKFDAAVPVASTDAMALGTGLGYDSWLIECLRGQKANDLKPRVLATVSF